MEIGSFGNRVNPLNLIAVPRLAIRSRWRGDVAHADKPTPRTSKHSHTYVARSTPFLDLVISWSFRALGRDRRRSTAWRPRSARASHVREIERARSRSRPSNRRRWIVDIPDRQHCHSKCHDRDRSNALHGYLRPIYTEVPGTPLSKNAPHDAQRTSIVTIRDTGCGIPAALHRTVVSW